MYVSVPKALISNMHRFQTILVLNVCQCSKGCHQYHARVSNKIGTQCMPVFQRDSLVPCKGFKQYQYSIYVSVPKALISNMQGFQTILLLNVCQCCKSTHQYHARVSNNIRTQCMSVFQRHSCSPKALMHARFQTILVLNVCQCSKGTHQYHARVSNKIGTQCMPVFQRDSLVPCKGFKQYQYSIYVSVPKALISNMQGFQTILLLNVCQCCKSTHQYHARVSINVITQSMSMFQRHSLVPCKGFRQYQYSMYVSIPKAFISHMQGHSEFQRLVKPCNVCQGHSFSNNISTQCMSVFQRHSLVPCKGFKQYQYSMYVSVPKALISTMQGFQTILVLNVCQCSKGTHQYHARVLNNISTQCMSVFQRHSLVTCKGFKQYQYSMYVSIPNVPISTMQGFQTILVLNVCQCSKGTHQ